MKTDPRKAALGFFAFFLSFSIVIGVAILMFTGLSLGLRVLL